MTPLIQEHRPVTIWQWPNEVPAPDTDRLGRYQEAPRADITISRVETMAVPLNGICFFKGIARAIYGAETNVLRKW